MLTRTYKNWSRFFQVFFAEYNAQSPQRQRQLIFRGQADSRWPLVASLDRIRTFPSADARDQTLSELVASFRHHAHRLDPDLELKGEIEWELLGRHHGLPTSVLDFTRSPYVACYFAFAEPPPKGAKRASIWLLDREQFGTDPAPEVAILDDEDYTRFVSRAQEQEGLFLKVRGVGPLNGLIGQHLQRHDIRTGPGERAMALATLRGMMITATSLFRDMDGAARAAATDVLQLGGN